MKTREDYAREYKARMEVYQALEAKYQEAKNPVPAAGRYFLRWSEWLAKDDPQPLFKAADAFRSALNVLEAHAAERYCSPMPKVSRLIHTGGSFEIPEHLRHLPAMLDQDAAP